MKPFQQRLISSLRTSAISSSTRASPRARAFGNHFFNSRLAARANSSTQVEKPTTPSRQSRTLFVPIVAAAVALGLSAFAVSRPARAEAPPSESPQKPDNVAKFRLEEIHKHDMDSENPWVIRGIRVYDVTNWIPVHPGGEVALRAAGGNLEPFWKIFTIHQKEEVYDILEQYFIGVVDPLDLVDGQVPADAIEDPFKNDPCRDERLRQLTARPCNAETPGEELADYITPNELFYVRNHMWVPETPAEQHTLTIELLDGTETVYTMAELREKFKSYTITAVLQCSGNRRSHMTKATRKTNGLQWDVGAIGNAEWTGVKLRDVLKDAGLDVDEPDEDVKHAWFMGSEAYSASIPIEKAVDRRGDVLLAYEMNGEPLPRDHGYPLRVLVPGNVAARSVKWVNKITLAEEESWSQWQRRDYKCFGPNIGSKPDWDSAVSIQEMPVQSAVTSVTEVKCSAPVSQGDQKLQEAYGIEEDYVKVEGYAFSGGGRRIVRVDVSADNGHTWNQAELVDCDAGKGSKTWGWQRWRFGIPQRQCGRWFLVKAVDEVYNTQPDNFESHWNARGNLASGWHRVPFKEPA